MKTKLLSLLAVVALSSTLYGAEDGAALYKKCAGCHGAKGEGKSIFPKIAGQSQAELSKKLNAYKNNSYGKARKTMMRPNVQNLSTQEITQIAEVVAKF